MDIGIIGLGRMGAGVAERLLQGGHSVTVYNRSPEKTVPFKEMGAKVANDLQELVTALPVPRTIWLYLPSGTVTREHIDALLPLLSKGDVILDGGNSRFSDTVAMGKRLGEKGIDFLDVGTSGGVGGRTRGYCMMIGGNKAVYTRLIPLWEAVAQPEGYTLVGPCGAGHYVKMVHNAIEYGMMQAYGEGMELLTDGSFAGNIDLKNATAVWQHGSIIESYLGELVKEMIEEDSQLSTIGSRIDDNGEGKWAIEEAIDQGIATPVITASLYARYDSRQDHSFGHKVVAMMRNKFGGHALASAKKQDG